METLYCPHSSNIQTVTYEPLTQELGVTFKDGQTYTHTSVPQSIFMGFQNADSRGAYYHRQVKGQYVTK